MGETGVLKKRTEVTMTTTLFTQLPTEWVTGETLARIIYETYHSFPRTDIELCHKGNNLNNKKNRRQHASCIHV